MKVTDKKSFQDWEDSVFGYGYGTGEKYIIPALKRFLELCNEGPDGICYDFEIIENELTPTVAWLLITILSNDEIIDYGTSPRFGWLTDRGIALKEFVMKYSGQELYDMAVNIQED